MQSWGTYIVIFRNGYHATYTGSYYSVMDLKEEIRESFEGQQKDLIKIVFCYSIQTWLVEGVEQIDEFMQKVW